MTTYQCYRSNTCHAVAALELFFLRALCLSQVPLTAVLLLFELTRDYFIIVPTLGAVGISYWVASLPLTPFALKTLRLKPSAPSCPSSSTAVASQDGCRAGPAPYAAGCSEDEVLVYKSNGEPQQPSAKAGSGSVESAAVSDVRHQDAEQGRRAVEQYNATAAAAAAWADRRRMATDAEGAATAAVAVPEQVCTACCNCIRGSAAELHAVHASSFSKLAP